MNDLEYKKNQLLALLIDVKNADVEESKLIWELRALSSRLGFFLTENHCDKPEFKSFSRDPEAWVKKEDFNETRRN